MTTFHRATIRRRCAAVATAVITAAGLVAYAPAAPASAATANTHYEECLTNRSAECVSLTGTEIAIIVGTTTGVASNIITGAGKVAIVYLVKKFLGWWTGPGTHKKNLWSGYFEDGGDSGGAGANTNLCMADTSLLSNITFQPCGANGTVWIEEQDNNGGNFNFSRYWINNGACTAINDPGWTSQGDCEVMSAGSLSQGSPLFLSLPEAPGGSLWQDWNP